MILEVVHLGSILVDEYGQIVCGSSSYLNVYMITVNVSNVVINIRFTFT